MKKRQKTIILICIMIVVIEAITLFFLNGGKEFFKKKNTIPSSNGVTWKKTKLDKDIEKIVADYDLEDLRSVITENQDFFRKYADAVIQNDDLGKYKKTVFKIFKVVIDNKEYLEEDYFLEQLKHLKIMIEPNVRNAFHALGVYFIRTNILQLEQEYDEEGVVIYHELMHAVFYLLSRRFVNEDYTGKVIVEGGADFYSMYYEDLVSFKSGYPSYRLVYGALNHIYGQDTMKEVFFDRDGWKLLRNHFLTVGKTEQEFEQFVQQNVNIEVDVIYLSDTLIDLYRATKGENWLEDHEFCYILYALLGIRDITSSKYQEEYQKIRAKYNGNLFHELKEENFFWRNSNFSHSYYTDGQKSYIIIRGINGKVKRIEYDFVNDKIIQHETIEVPE